jgi:hypothetical protein
MKSFALASSFFLFLAGTLGAQEFSHFAFNVGAGFTMPAGGAASVLDTGWNVRGGAGINFSPYGGLLVDVGYNNMGISSATLATAGAPGGRVSVLSATLDPIVHVTPKSHFDIYLTGGGGLFHRYQEFTAPSTAVLTGFNPFFGFYSVGVPANQILSSYSVNKPGIDAGIGIAFGSKWHGKFFAEARYNRIFMGNRYSDDMEFIPVTFGFRW